MCVFFNCLLFIYFIFPFHSLTSSCLPAPACFFSFFFFGLLLPPSISPSRLPSLSVPLPPGVFVLLKSFKDASGTLAHTPHSAERGTLH